MKTRRWKARQLTYNQPVFILTSSKGHKAATQRYILHFFSFSLVLSASRYLIKPMPMKCYSSSASFYEIH